MKPWSEAKRITAEKQMRQKSRQEVFFVFLAKEKQRGKEPTNTAVGLLGVFILVAFECFRGVFH